MPLSITTTSPLPSAFAFVPYLQTMVATGGTPPYTWSITSGTLPPGLTLKASTGEISGVPTLINSESVQITVTDAVAATFAAFFSISVIVPDYPSQQFNISIPINVPFSFVLSQVWAEQSFIHFYGSPFLISKFGSIPPIHPITYVVNPSGPLPPGLSLALDGTISGTPTALGTYPLNCDLTTAPNVLSPPPSTYAVLAQGTATIVVAQSAGACRYRPIFRT